MGKVLSGIYIYIYFFFFFFFFIVRTLPFILLLLLLLFFFVLIKLLNYVCVSVVFPLWQLAGTLYHLDLFLFHCKDIC